MVCFFNICTSKLLSQCYGNKVFVPLIMPKRYRIQSFPVKKKLKLTDNSSGIKKPTITTSEKSNLTNSTNLGKMQRANSLYSNSSNTGPPKLSNLETLHNERDVKVVYLDVPVKSENDKKEYRVIRLENGLTALLIADVHSSEAFKNGFGDTGAESASSSDDSEESDADDEESDETDEDDDDDDDEVTDEFKEAGEEDAKCPISSKRSKKEEKMAACALCVGVGSFSDPPEIPGLAHFLEHMVFMGSEKYPEENDFDAFIKKRGGSDNATTECEQTSFYFEIQEKHLFPALDRFAQFFISPLMKRDAISREREVVESEFQMALPSDLHRKEQLFCSFAKPNHPATKFTWGNLLTLRDSVRDDKLYEQLHKFRERHYSAHRMTLAIQARLPLDKLEQYVKDCFSDVPTNNLPGDDFSKFKGADSFDTPDFRKMYKVKPFKDVCQIELTWAMPPLHHLYKSKPHQYVSYIVGHEGKGSLISYLRKKMWCLDIFSGNAEGGFEHSSMYALFSLSLILTDEGHEHLKEVLDAIFSYLNMLRKGGPQKRLYDEIDLIEKTNFRFADEEEPSDYVESLCENMHYYAPQDYITGSDLYFEYNPSAIQDCMDMLTPDNVNIIIFDKRFNDEEFEKVEPWFKTKYADEAIPPEWIKSWKTVEPLAEFHLPEPNIFLTTDFSLIPIPENTPKYPVKVHSDEILEVWYRPDPKFRLPECFMYFYLISPSSVATSESTAMMELFVAILKHLLVEETYAATAAELNHSIYASDKGIVLKIDGFNQKQPILLKTVLKSLANCSNLVSENLFDIMKEERLKAYYNTFLKPSKLVKDLRLSILLLHHWTSTDKHAAISGIDYGQFLNFAKHFADHLYIQCIVQGNMTKEDVVKNVKSCVEILKCGPLLPNTMPEFRVTQIPVGVQYCRVKNFNSSDANSVVTNYYQSATSSIKLSVIIELLLMIMEEPLFNQLRTLEQLGYNVFCLMRDTFGILGYSITVCTQATKYTTEHVDDRIEEFMKSFNEIMLKMTEEEFSNVKEALVKLKQCADIHLKEEISRNWAEVTTREYLFDRIEREIAAVDSITLKELRNWIKDHTKKGNNFRKLSIQIVGCADKKDDADVSSDVESKTESREKPVQEKTREDFTVRVKAKFPLEYLTNSPDEAEKPDECYILDIEEFKKGLHVYPIQRTTL
ncbi:nardilysin-like [Belonocnema kinseyi]|uniref:nardilysin-like n=1 Tax=Belonocnema kinseyi TaxID=2817044 RepID=UPI00143DFBD9|nr:nardilysin-like [Belonocnema kinseyi]